MASDGPPARPKPTPLSEALPPGMVEASSPAHQQGGTPALSPSQAETQRQVAPGLMVGSLSPLHQEHLDLRTPTDSPSRGGSKSVTSRTSPSRQGSKERRPSKHLSHTPQGSSRRPSFRNSKSELLETKTPGTDDVRLERITVPAAGDADEQFAAGTGSRQPSRLGHGHLQSSLSPAGSHGHASSAGSRSTEAGSQQRESIPHSEGQGPSAEPTERRTSEEIYAELRAEVDANAELHAGDRDYNGGLELAALARLRVWEHGDKGYSLQELMDLVRWMEARTEPEPPRSTILWHGFCATKPQRRIGPVVLAFSILGVVLVAIAATTALALIITTPAPIATTGMLEGSEEQPAGLAAAMHPHSLLDYEQLSAGQLRHAEDVVLQQHGDFHYYRLAGATQLMSGGVRLASQDGSVIRVEDKIVSLKPAWALEEVVDMDGMAKLESARGSSSLSFAGAFRALSLQ